MDGMAVIYAREIKIRLSRQNQRLCADALHGGLEVAIVRLLSGTVSRLPGIEHHEHIFWIFYALARRL